MEFPTKDALDKYLKEHPDADKSKHSVKETKDPEASQVESFEEDYDNFDGTGPGGAWGFSSSQKSKVENFVGQGADLKSISKVIENGNEDFLRFTGPTKKLWDLLNKWAE